MCTVITNREISSEKLLAEAVEEIVESARKNDVSDEQIAAELRERASALADPEAAE